MTVTNPNGQKGTITGSALITALVNKDKSELTVGSGILFSVIPGLLNQCGILWLRCLEMSSVPIRDSFSHGDPDLTTIEFKILFDGERLDSRYAICSPLEMERVRAKDTELGNRFIPLRLETTAFRRFRLVELLLTVHNRHRGLLFLFSSAVPVCLVLISGQKSIVLCSCCI